MSGETQDWDAVETAARIKSGDVSADEVVRAAIARAESAGALGAIVSETFERALAGLGSTEGPLAGVPTFIKDLAHQAGVPTGWGSRAAGSYVPRRSDAFVTALEATGLVSLGKSATPELGLTATTEPVGREPCRNPWNTAHSAGGSSGGAGALVAAGVVPIAHASDGGGSIRIPASCCGLVGLKPSRFRADMKGSNTLPVNIAVDGCVTRTVRDTVAFFEAFESVQPPVRGRPIGKVAEAPSRRLRIGVYTNPPTGFPIHTDNREAALASAKICEGLGHRVDEIGCPFEGQVIDDFLRYWGLIAWGQARGAKQLLHPGFDTSKLEPWSKGIARHFTSRPLAGLRATRRLRAFAGTYARVMKRYDVLISPVTTAPPPELGHLSTELPFDTAYMRLKEYVPYTPIQNASGAPAISLPLGRNSGAGPSGGLPLGVQFAAAVGDDRLLLELARSIEAAAPWDIQAPRQST